MKDFVKIRRHRVRSESDSYTCSEGRLLKASGESRSKTASGYGRTVMIYKCESCAGCPDKSRCIHGSNCKTSIEERNRTLHVSRAFDEKQAQCLERITTGYGTQLRMNRSIQAEGSFACIKDLGLKQYLYRSKENVPAESVITAQACLRWPMAGIISVCQPYATFCKIQMQQPAFLYCNFLHLSVAKNKRKRLIFGESKIHIKKSDSVMTGSDKCTVMSVN